MDDNVVENTSSENVKVEVKEQVQHDAHAENDLENSPVEIDLENRPVEIDLENRPVEINLENRPVEIDLENRPAEIENVGEEVNVIDNITKGNEDANVIDNIEKVREEEPKDTDTDGESFDSETNSNGEGPIEIEKLILDEQGYSDSDPLPPGWKCVQHASGLKVYVNTSARVCTAARPYFLGPGSVKRHVIPRSAIPCLSYMYKPEDDVARDEDGSGDKNIEGEASGVGEPKAKLNSPDIEIDSVKDIQSTIPANAVKDVIFSMEPGIHSEYIQISEEIKILVKDCAAEKTVQECASPVEHTISENITVQDAAPDDIFVSHDYQYISKSDVLLTQKLNIINTKEHDLRECYNFIEQWNIPVKDDDTKDNPCVDVEENWSMSNDIYIQDIGTLFEGIVLEKNIEEYSTAQDDVVSIENAIKEHIALQENFAGENDKEHIVIHEYVVIQNDGTITLNGAEVEDYNTQQMSMKNDAIEHSSTKIYNLVMQEDITVQDDIALYGDIAPLGNGTNEHIDLQKDATLDEVPVQIDDAPQDKVVLIINDKEENVAAQESVGTGGNDVAVERSATPEQAPIDPVKNIKPDELNTYCQKLFKYKQVSVIHFNNWADFRKYYKFKKRSQKVCNAPTAEPKGPIKSKHSQAHKLQLLIKTDKTPVCILYEYVQNILKSKLSYLFSEVENPNAPYAATVVINDIKYCVGYGSSKKIAKYNAAKLTVELLNQEKDDSKPTEEDKAENATHSGNLELESNCFFNSITILDTRVTDFSAKRMKPLPYDVLKYCLNRNKHLGDAKLTVEDKGEDEDAYDSQSGQYTMTVGTHQITVLCNNKSKAKQQASQIILHKLHSHIPSWGALLRLYCMGDLEQSATLHIPYKYIDPSRVPHPNEAILQDLKNVFKSYRERGLEQYKGKCDLR